MNKYAKSNNIDEIQGEKERKITPFVQFFALPGCTVVKTWTEPFEDRVGNKAILTKCEYTDKKGKLHEFVRRVEWVSFVK
jgi:hypothetical protein